MEMAFWNMCVIVPLAARTVDEPFEGKNVVDPHGGHLGGDRAQLATEYTSPLSVLPWTGGGSRGIDPSPYFVRERSSRKSLGGRRPTGAEGVPEGVGQCLPPWFGQSGTLVLVCLAQALMDEERFLIATPAAKEVESAST